MFPECARAYPLPVGQVHLWIVDGYDTESSSVLAQYENLLSSEERTRADRFHIEKYRRQYVVTRALVRTVLSGYCSVDPRVWRFRATAYGRPEIDAPHIASPISFNIAHTDGLIVCACARSVRIGVDTELIRPEPLQWGIEERCFSRFEVAELRTARAEVRAERFLHHWTLKEAYVKALGTGLSTPLTQFSVSFGWPGTVRRSFHDGSNEDPRRWWCCLMRIAPAHVLAVCMERTTVEIPQVLARRTTPLVGDESLVCDVIASSAASDELLS